MTKHSTPEDQWSLLAKAAKNGDKKAYRQLLTEITPFIKSVTAPSLANADWVDDLSQNILISVHKSLATYGPERPFKPWLLAIINSKRFTPLLMAMGEPVGS